MLYFTRTYGHAYFCDEEVEKNCAEALKFFLLPAAQGFSASIMKLPSRCFQLFKKSAEAGRKDTNFDVGGCLHSGNGVPRTWLKREAGFKRSTLISRRYAARAGDGAWSWHELVEYFAGKGNAKDVAACRFLQRSVRPASLFPSAAGDDETPHQQTTAL